MNNLEKENKHHQAYLVNQALKLILRNPDREFCSISWLQRMLGIGYNLASDLRIELINRGIVAPLDELNRTKTLVKDKDFASSCCGTSIIENTDLCSLCKEHCEPELLPNVITDI